MNFIDSEVDMKEEFATLRSSQKLTADAGAAAAAEGEAAEALCATGVDLAEGAAAVICARDFESDTLDLRPLTLWKSVGRTTLYLFNSFVKDASSKISILSIRLRNILKSDK